MIRVHCHLCDEFYDFHTSAVQAAQFVVATGREGGTNLYVVCPSPSCGCWLPIWPSPDGKLKQLAKYDPRTEVVAEALYDLLTSQVEGITPDGSPYHFPDFVSAADERRIPFLAAAERIVQALGGPKK